MHLDDSRLSPKTCDALLRDPNGIFRQMWNRQGWRQLHDEEPCWGWQERERRNFFSETLRGSHCHSDWYEGSIGWQNFHSDAPGVLGFDDAIDHYCASLNNRGRRLDEPVSNETAAQRRRRRLESSWVCTHNSRNILMLFGNNIHGTGAGYNSCRNLEWQMCAAMVKLPGQRTPTVIFSLPPNSLDAEGGRPLGRCGGYSPEGCGRHAYSNDDIFFLEVCMYSKICQNNDELFRVGAERPFRCQVSDSGFRELESILTENGPPP